MARLIRQNSEFEPFMKKIFKALMLCAALVSSVSAQEETPQVAFVRIVNAVSPGVGNASFIVDGRNLYEDGYKLGQTTGGYGVAVGTRTIQVEKEGVQKGTTKLTLGLGETVTLIAFAERLPVEKENDPPKWTIKLLRLKQATVERGYGLSLVSVCGPSETVVELGLLSTGKAVRSAAKRLSITKVDIGNARGEVVVKSGGKNLTMVSPDSPGNYVVILYETAEGETEALSFYDPKFVVAG
jgi:hypothetical protein